MSYPTHKTTIDQHQGTHEATGLSIHHLHDVITDLSPYADRNWDDLSAEDQALWAETTEAYHDACVELESLDADTRERAKEILLNCDSSDLESMSHMVRRAIGEAKTEQAVAI